MNLTARVRDWVRTWVPLEDLLPDQLPAYVRSPVYYFGVIAISSLAMLILSGFTLAFFGPQWWHVNDVGRFVNSVHFWSTQAFFFSITLHLWSEFTKGSWRHGRRLTWAVGAITFVVAIGTAFTGYLSQTNFDSQWIAVQGKDAMNGIGIGSFFNLMDFGQMFGIHVVLLPLLVSLLVAGHLLQVRIRGVVRPYAESPEDEKAREELWAGDVGPGWSPWTSWLAHPRDRRAERPLGSDQAVYYRGIRQEPYDLIREGLIALLGVAVFAFVFAGVFSSPDEPPITLQQYAQQDPVGFLTTAMAELSGTSEIAQYGPPYNNGSGSVQYLGPISLQELAGVTIPINTAQDFVLQPLSTITNTDPTLRSALERFSQASADQQATWDKAYTDALGKATSSNGKLALPSVDAGPLPTMMDTLLSMGQSGALDGLLLSTRGFYQLDFTKPLLFLSEDTLPARAKKLGMLPTEWGMMNETGNFPGQAWLWLYTLWYQIPPYSTSPNGDVFVWVTMAVLTLILVVFPFIPYVNRLPFHLGIHRLIWREYYRDRERPPAPPPAVRL